MKRTVLAALMDGKSAEEISSVLFVSVATVRSQIRSVLQKLNVHSQVAAVSIANRSGSAANDRPCENLPQRVRPDHQIRHARWRHEEQIVPRPSAIGGIFEGRTT